MDAVHEFEVHTKAFEAGSLDVTEVRLGELALIAVDEILDRNPHLATELIKACEDIEGPDAMGKILQPRPINGGGGSAIAID